MKNFWIQKYLLTLHKRVLKAVRDHMFEPVDDLLTYLKRNFPGNHVLIRSNGKSTTITVGPVEVKILVP